MSTFVFVHGSWHGAWCWRKIVPRLEAAGHRALAIDLPGHGADERPLDACTLKSYAEIVLHAVDGAGEPVVLVGHSMGGVVVTQAAEWRPERVRRLAYVCAFLPLDGQSLLELAKTDAESDVLPNLIVDEALGLHWIEPEAVPRVFYDRCGADDVAFATARLVREPLAPVATPVRRSDAAFGRIPRVYIETRADHCLSPALQRRMLEATPCELRSLDTDHSPFFSDPDGLTKHLINL